MGVKGILLALPKQTLTPVQNIKITQKVAVPERKVWAKTQQKEPYYPNQQGNNQIVFYSFVG